MIRRTSVGSLVEGSEGGEGQGQGNDGLPAISHRSVMQAES